MICTENLKINKSSRETVVMNLKDFMEKLKKEIITNLVSDGWEEEDAKDTVNTEDLGSYVIDIIETDKDFLVDFDCENISAEEDYLTLVPSHGNISEILGFHEEGGFCWLGVNAGGDWEEPVFFIVYYDGKKFRGYVPLVGNTFNSMNMCALGNNDGDGTYEVEGSVKLMKEDFLTTMAISGVSIIDLVKKPMITSIKGLGSKMMVFDGEELEELLTAITNLSDDEIISEVVRDFANKNNLKIE